MNKLSTDEIIEILENNQISQCSADEKAQVMDFAFSRDFMDSNEKGEKKEYFEPITDSSPLIRVDWLEGYGDARPINITLKALSIAQEWKDLETDDLAALKALHQGGNYILSDPSGSIMFTRLF